MEIALALVCINPLVLSIHRTTYAGSPNQGKDQRENTAVCGVTAVLIAIVVAGSLWVMHNANENMMPMQMSPEQARAHE
jgi:cytochrome o ubiquinol oxidase operon protein cyoD